VAEDTSTAWIEDGEKYGLVGLTIKLDGHLPPGKISPNLCKIASRTPDILDAENQIVQQRAWGFYVGLLLASTFSPGYRPILLTGSRRGAEIGIRQQQNLDSPIAGVVTPYPSILPSDIRTAALLAENLETLATAPLAGGHWRLFRTLNVYTQARTIGQIVDRIHQYCRCIDGLILPEVGRTRQQFKSRTEMFVGPGHHDLMGELYDVRSAVEHLHENRYLETFDRALRLDLVKKEAIVEYVAREALARIIGDRGLWPHFANTPALERFWASTLPERRKIWGNPIDPLAAIADFDPQYIHDGALGR
jgi:hypothetical protein